MKAQVLKAGEGANTGLSLIGITRGGYAGSTRRSGRRTFNYVDETRLVLDHFGVKEIVSFGLSSGGPATSLPKAFA